MVVEYLFFGTADLRIVYNTILLKFGFVFMLFCLSLLLLLTQSLVDHLCFREKIKYYT